VSMMELDGLAYRVGEYLLGPHGSACSASFARARSLYARLCAREAKNVDFILYHVT